MKNWLRSQKKGIIIDCLILTVFMIVAFYYTDWLSLRAQKIETTYPKTKVTQVEVGNNASMLANSITGATIHLDYSTYLRYAEDANETFVIEEHGANTTEVRFVAYTLKNGYTYSAALPFQKPSEYRLVSTETKNNQIYFNWQLDPWYPGKQLYITAALLAAIGMLINYEGIFDKKKIVKVSSHS